MRIEITPEPTREERAAIEQALLEARANGRHEHGPWWIEGLREALELEDDRHAAG